MGGLVPLNLLKRRQFQSPILTHFEVRRGLVTPLAGVSQQTATGRRKQPVPVPKPKQPVPVKEPVR
jgi:hypothetical protein